MRILGRHSLSLRSTTHTRGTVELQPGQLQRVVRAALLPVCRLGWRVSVDGLENVPDEGPAIFAPNHISVLDSAVLPLLLPRPIHFVGKAEYMDKRRYAQTLPALGLIPIDRSGGAAARAALDQAASILDDGGFFGIYPEGTRSRSGQLHRGHTGVARLAMETGSPVIPVGIIGTDRVQPPDTNFPRPFRNVQVRFGEPRRLDSATDDESRLKLRSFTDELMAELARLTGQTYVDSYSTRPSAAKPPKVSTSTGAGSSTGSVVVSGTSGERSTSSPPVAPASSRSASRLQVRPLSLDEDDRQDEVSTRRVSSAVLAPRPLL